MRNDSATICSDSGINSVRQEFSDTGDNVALLLAETVLGKGIRCEMALTRGMRLVGRAGFAGWQRRWEVAVNVDYCLCNSVTYFVPKSSVAFMTPVD